MDGAFVCAQLWGVTIDLLLTLALVLIAALGAALLAFGGDSQVGVAGVLLGGVMGYLTASIAERSRRRNEDQHRFEDERRTAYVRMLEAAREYENYVRNRNVMLAIQREQPDLAERIEIPDWPDSTSMNLVVDEIELLAPFWTYSTAHMYSSALFSLAMAEADEERLAKAKAEVSEWKRKFLERAKDDLGTPTGVMTRWQERRWRLRHPGRWWATRKRRKGPPPTGDGGGVDSAS